MMNRVSRTIGSRCTRRGIAKAMAMVAVSLLAVPAACEVVAAKDGKSLF